MGNRLGGCLSREGDGGCGACCAIRKRDKEHPLPTDYDLELRQEEARQDSGEDSAACGLCRRNKGDVQQHDEEIVHRREREFEAPSLRTDQHAALCVEQITPARPVVPAKPVPPTSPPGPGSGGSTPRTPPPVVLQDRPGMIIVSSKYGNVKGFYDKGDWSHLGFPVYRRIVQSGPRGPFIWHESAASDKLAAAEQAALLAASSASTPAMREAAKEAEEAARGRWICSSEVGDSRRFRWAVYSNAQNPARISQEELIATDKVTRIQASTDMPELLDCSQVVVIMSQLRNLQGIYERRKDDYNFYPVFTRTGDGNRFLWHHIFDNKWILSDEVGNQSWLAAIESDVADPSKIEKHELEKDCPAISSICTPGSLTPELVNCPAAISAVSKFKEVHGVFTRLEKDHQYYPVYHSSTLGTYIWHDLYFHQWVISNAVDSPDYFCTIASDAQSPLQIEESKLADVESVDRFEIR
eukprot:gnl/TRDRNA2_/TRDRNA2_166723_c0_seq1.p1 gnl/TRDRNA2_/TRDRNA2_166723_c0~~gnl/TRDRNA2_/TRDRNA2_166723_c0_seq1.p1  ORF type:complete len:469 (+),score=53.26 gnl/TRDRNA2_/TRDRNA2_166723_c0_seq1:136-1542(+)